VIARLLYRIGTLLLVGDVLYLFLFDTFWGGARPGLFRAVLAAGVACVVGGLVASLVARARSRITARVCPRCGRRVAPGRVYCEDHLVETINRYRDQERERGR
jgi:hypothetical protein